MVICINACRMVSPIFVGFTSIPWPCLAMANERCRQWWISSRIILSFCLLTCTAALWSLGGQYTSCINSWIIYKYIYFLLYEWSIHGQNKMGYVRIACYFEWQWKVLRDVGTIVWVWNAHRINRLDGSLLFYSSCLSLFYFYLYTLFLFFLSLSIFISLSLSFNSYPFDDTKNGISTYSKSPDDDVFRHLASTYSNNHLTMHKQSVRQKARLYLCVHIFTVYFFFNKKKKKKKKGEKNPLTYEFKSRQRNEKSKQKE